MKNILRTSLGLLLLLVAVGIWQVGIERVIFALIVFFFALVLFALWPISRALLSWAAKEDEKFRNKQQR